MGITKTFLKDLTYQVNGAAIEVHKFLGPGLLESIYHKCLKNLLPNCTCNFERRFADSLYIYPVLAPYKRCLFLSQHAIDEF